MAEFPAIEELVVGLFDRGDIGYVASPEKFIKIKSGRMSPNYVDTRDALSFSDKLPIPISKQKRVAQLVVDAYRYGLRQVGQTIPYDHIAAIPQAVTSVVGAAGYINGDSILAVRVKEGEKGYGNHKPIQGVFSKGDRVIAIDNVISSGGAKEEFRRPVEEAGLVIPTFLVLFERQEGGREKLAQDGFGLESVILMSAATEILLANRRINQDQAEWSQDYIARYGGVIDVE